MCACIGNASCSNIFSLHWTPCLGHTASQGLISFSTVATVIVPTLSKPLLIPYPQRDLTYGLGSFSILVRLGLSACSVSVCPCSSSSRVRFSCSCRRRASSLSETYPSGQTVVCIVPVGRVSSSRPYPSSARPRARGSPVPSSTGRRRSCLDSSARYREEE